MPVLWCTHEACLASVEPLATAAELAAHMAQAHGDVVQAPAAPHAHGHGHGLAHAQAQAQPDEEQQPAGVRHKVVIVPGNGNGDVHGSNWYSEAHEALQKFCTKRCVGHRVDVVLENMPDAHKAREKIWIPFLLDTLQVDEHTIIIGHSSGAVAAMRLAEKQPVLGIVLVAACHTDLGMKSERVAGYYSRPWLWDKIKENAGFIMQYHSTDDPFIPVAEARHVATALSSDYFELTRKSHFFSYASVEPMVHEVCKKIRERIVSA